MRRRLERQDTDIHVERVLKRRLIPEYGAARIHAARDANGDSVKSWLANQVPAQKAAKKYVSNKIVSELISRFNLEQTLELTDASGSDIEEELEEALSFALQKNPAFRSTVEIEKYFEYLQDALPKSQIIRFIQIVSEPKKVLRHHMVTMQWAVLKYFARNV